MQDEGYSSQPSPENTLYCSLWWKYSILLLSLLSIWCEKSIWIICWIPKCTAGFGGQRRVGVSRRVVWVEIYGSHKIRNCMPSSNAYGQPDRKISFFLTTSLMKIFITLKIFWVMWSKQTEESNLDSLQWFRTLTTCKWKFGKQNMVNWTSAWVLGLWPQPLPMRF